MGSFVAMAGVNRQADGLLFLDLERRDFSTRSRELISLSRAEILVKQGSHSAH